MANPFKVVRKTVQAETHLSESRRSPRRAYERPIGVLLHGTYNVFRALQLGEGGLSFTADKKMSVNPDSNGAVKDRLVISIILPGVAEAIVTQAEIAYENSVGHKGYNYGVQFIEMPLHVRRIIRNYVTAKTQEEAERELEARIAGSTADKSGTPQ